MGMANITEQFANNLHITFSWYDHALFFLMLVFSAAIGIYFGFFGNKQSTAEEYLLGGKEMKVLPIAISLTASTLSATMNSQAGAIYEDFISPFMSKDITPKQVSNLLKLIVLIIGILSTVLVFAVEHMGSILPISFSLQGFSLGPLVGLFSLGMLFPSANAKGALFGGLGSLLIMIFIIVGSQIQKASRGFEYEPKPLSTAGCGNMTIIRHGDKSMDSSADDIFYLFKITHYYYAPIGTLLVIFIGLPVSFLTKTKDDKPINPDLISPVAHFMIPAEESKKGEYYSIKQALNIVTEK